MHLRYLLAVFAFLLDSAIAEKYGYTCRPDTNQRITFENKKLLKILTKSCNNIKSATSTELIKNAELNKSPAYLYQVKKFGYPEDSIVVRVPGPKGVGTGFIITNRQCGIHTLLYMNIEGLRRCYHGTISNLLHNKVNELFYAPVAMEMPHSSPFQSSVGHSSHSGSNSPRRR
ncbi:unnamed protein product [Blumeria hordei]|uniref:Uncharacterized protein n=1 Tax=Blumeria hordei TaxID=2867405 RepID=A0A383UIM7_BLUHO|nr:unnamed protein product [Blumeria hordei]